MNFSPAIAIDQIDTVLKRYPGNGGWQNTADSDISEFNTLAIATVERLSPPGSTHLVDSKKQISQYGLNNGVIMDLLNGVLKALKIEYQTGNLRSISELIHADVFSDFLEMADYLLQEGYKDPAAVIAGSTLEEHLRKLCGKVQIPVKEASGKPKKADTMNSELYNARVYNKLDQKAVTTWLDLRNKAAHGHYTDYTKEQVRLQLYGIGEFLTRNPA